MADEKVVIELSPEEAKEFFAQRSKRFIGKIHRKGYIKALAFGWLGFFSTLLFVTSINQIAGTSVLNQIGFSLGGFAIMFSLGLADALEEE